MININQLCDHDLKQLIKCNGHLDPVTLMKLLDKITKICLEIEKEIQESVENKQ